MSSRKVERRLTAIVAADVAGYSRLVALDEEATLAAFSQLLHEVIEPCVGTHDGRIFKTAGDGVLLAFESVVNALQCAVTIQATLAERAAAAPEARPMQFRIGVHCADVVIQGPDLLGDGVNIASRLEALAEPGGICVSARVQEDTHGRLDIGFEDMGEQQLKNIPRPVRVYRVHREGHTRADPPRLALPNKPSIAVLPFRNMSGDPGQEYFADAISEDLIIALSRWRWFFVIARDSSFAFRTREVDLKRIGQELGVRYLLEGSVRKSGARVRINAQLIEASTASHLWADSVDGDLTDILALQDEIVEQVVGAIAPAMLDREGVRVGRKNLHDYSALDCFQRGMWHLNKVSLEGYQEALRYFREAIARDAELPLGHIGLARILYGGAVYGWSRKPGEDLQEAHEAAQTAIALDARDAIAYYALSGAALYLNRHDEALDAARKAVALNQNFAYAHVRLGQVLTYCGRAAEGIAPIQRGLRRSPYDPQLGVLLGALALAHYHAEDYEAAAGQAQAAVARNYRGAAVVLAASLARLGRRQELETWVEPDLVARILRAQPRLQSYAHQADRLRLLEGLWLAGLSRAEEATA